MNKFLIASAIVALAVAPARADSAFMTSFKQDCSAHSDHSAFTERQINAYCGCMASEISKIMIRDAMQALDSHPTPPPTKQRAADIDNGIKLEMFGIKLVCNEKLFEN
jgi:hypothetical protein